MGFLSPAKHTKKSWTIFGIFSIVSLIVWYCFTYPHFSFLDLSINRSKALSIAQDFLKNEQRETLDNYDSAVVFHTDSWADRYMQKAMSFDDILAFLDEHNLEIFYWRVRFFQENKKEQHIVTVSPSTGEVIRYFHVLDDSDARSQIEQETARDAAAQYLGNRFGFEIDNHEIHAEKSKKFDHRKDHTFQWAKKGVAVPWSEEKDTGTAKLLTTASVSGDDTLEFTKLKMDIPDQFKRFLHGEKAVGNNFAVAFRLFYFLILAVSIFYVTTSRNNVVLHNTKNFAIMISACLFILYFIAILNNFERTLYNYVTTSSFISYLWRYFMDFMLDSFIVTIGILMPCLAGESMRYLVNPKHTKGSFLHFLQSSWATRDVFKMICLGYLVGIIMLGIQSSAFAIGERYMGVWVEYYWLSQLSTAYVPFISAFILAFNASVSEEIAFRMFCINYGQKLFKKAWPAVIISSVIWGFGHSTYNIFPMWFRGLEVGLLGIFLSIVYLKYGIIPAIVGHYIFDAFWSASPYLLGKSTSFDFLSSLAILILPFGLGLIAYLCNNKEQERPLRWNLSIHQIFNLKILKSFLKHNDEAKAQSPEELRQKISAHGWDIVVVETAIEETRKEL
jgi:membrane protease YdiL (CAAX protease family)